MSTDKRFPSEMPTRKAWQGMMNRCYTVTNKDYPAVGGRGIKVCDRWFNNYANFLEDMGEKPDNAIFTRHDEDKDFTIDNCYWQPKVHSRTNPLYAIWKGIKRRCGLTGRISTAPRAAMYIARGVSMDPDWAENFATFVKDVGERPTPKHQLDRIDNDLGYIPGNVRWALPKENANNRFDNVVIEMDGERRTLSQWAEFYDLGINTVAARFHRVFVPVDAKYNTHRKCEQINQATGAVVGVYDSLKEAAEKTGILRGTIAKCISGGNATAGGFAWRYRE